MSEADDAADAVQPDAGSEAAPVAPHETSAVVWDAPTPAIVGVAPRVKVGVQCAHGCGLAGQAIEVRDPEGAVVATGVLGDTPAEGTEALYWTELALPTPASTGVVALSAHFAPAGLEAEHLGANAAFSFRADPRPEHRAVVRVVSEATGEPVPKAEVRMNHYAAYTDANGQAWFDLPGGRYVCTIRKLGYAAEPVEVEVASGVSLEVRAGKGETREELEARLSSWEAYPWC